MARLINWSASGVRWLKLSLGQAWNGERPRHEGAKESKWNVQMAALRGDQLDQKGRARRPKHRIGK